MLIVCVVEIRPERLLCELVDSLSPFTASLRSDGSFLPDDAGQEILRRHLERQQRWRQRQAEFSESANIRRARTADHKYRGFLSDSLPLFCFSSCCLYVCVCLSVSVSDCSSSSRFHAKQVVTRKPWENKLRGQPQSLQPHPTPSDRSDVVMVSAGGRRVYDHDGSESFEYTPKQRTTDSAKSRRNPRGRQLVWHQVSPPSSPPTSGRKPQPSRRAYASVDIPSLYAPNVPLDAVERKHVSENDEPPVTVVRQTRSHSEIPQSRQPSYAGSSGSDSSIVR